MGSYTYQLRSVAPHIWCSLGQWREVGYEDGMVDLTEAWDGQDLDDSCRVTL